MIKYHCKKNQICKGCYKAPATTSGFCRGCYVKIKLGKASLCISCGEKVGYKALKGNCSECFLAETVSVPA